MPFTLEQLAVRVKLKVDQELVFEAGALTHRCHRERPWYPPDPFDPGLHATNAGFIHIAVQSLELSLLKLGHERENDCHRAEALHQPFTCLNAAVKMMHRNKVVRWLCFSARLD